ncbi:MAG: cytochrome c [Pseudomonadota bacterium]
MKKVFLIIPLAVIVVLLAYEGLILYDNHFRYGRMWETPAVRPLEIPALPVPAGVVPFEGGEELLKLTPAQDIKSPLKRDDPEKLRLGEARYFTFCAQCHGKDFDGKGTVGQSFHPPLPDLKSREVQSLSEGVLFKRISYGTPNGRQPPLATTIDLADRWRIIAFIQSLGERR